MRIDWSGPAFADPQEISLHIENDRGIATANRVIREIYDAIQTLRRFPYRGRSGRIQDTRELVIAGRPWLAIYRLDRDRVIVLNIVHGAQRFP